MLFLLSLCLSLSLASYIDLFTLHTLQDLYPYGADVWHPFTLKSRWGSHLACQAWKYGSGFGLVGWWENAAQVICVMPDAGTYHEIPYGGQCNVQNLDSIFCQAYVNGWCLSAGYAGASGVIGANENVAATICLAKAWARTVTFPSLAQFRSVDPTDPFCNENSIVTSMDCMVLANKYCIAKGFGAGFAVTEYDSGNGAGSMICVYANVSSVFTGSSERPIQEGTMAVGGPSFAGELCYADSVQNNFNYPIQWNAATMVTTWPGPTWSSDMCFSLNRQATWQFNNSVDGEFACVYSDESQYPSMDYQRLGATPVLYPGETLIFQGTPRWGSTGQNLYVGAYVSFTRYTGATPGVRRIRFPQSDSGYSISAHGSVNVYAGCNGPSCPVKPAGGGWGGNSANWWYPCHNATTIRGLTIFMSNGIQPGTNGVKGCVHVVEPGGRDITPPWCFNLHALKFGPEAYNIAFGPQQQGSAFVAFKMPVPAGMLIDIDYTLYADSNTGLDFGGYLWVDM